MATENVYLLSLKQNGQWVEIPALKGDKGDAGFTYAHIVISISDWNGGNTCTKSVPGLTVADHVVISPAPTSMSEVLASNVYCTGQGVGTLSFICSTIPLSAITFEVMYGV